MEKKESNKKQVKRQKKRSRRYLSELEDGVESTDRGRKGWDYGITNESSVYICLFSFLP
jgi:hypothetical protein